MACIKNIGCFPSCEGILFPFGALETGVHTIVFEWLGVRKAITVTASAGQKIPIPNFFNESSDPVFSILQPSGQFLCWDPANYTVVNCPPGCEIDCEFYKFWTLEIINTTGTYTPPIPPLPTSGNQVYNIDSSQVTDNEDSTYIITIVGAVDGAMAWDENGDVYQYYGDVWTLKASGDTYWGSIGGTLSDQTDLWNALNTSGRVIPDVATLRTTAGKKDGEQIYLEGYYSKGSGSGILVWDENSTDADNGGTIFDQNVDINGRWFRLYKSYIDVKDFGAQGDGITNDSSSIQSAIDAAGAGGEVRFPSKGTYLVADTLKVYEQTWIGYGAVVNRNNAVYTTLTSAVPSGANTINVLDGSVFKVGDTVMIRDSTSPNGGEANGEISQANVSITNINANILTVDKGINLPTNGNLSGSGEYASGEIIFKTYNLITQLGTGNAFKIYGVVFDGNRSNNALNYSWRHSYTIHGTGHGTVIADCTFRNIPNENINVGNGTIIRDNKAYNLNGSFTHISETPVNYQGQIIIKGNILNDICEKENSINGHNEGAFNFSNWSFRTIITGNQVVNCGEAFCGNVAGDTDSEIIITNNKAVNCNGVIHLWNGDGINEQITITNNQFVNCLWLSGDNNRDKIHDYGGGFYGVIISNNQFYNVKLYFEQTSHLLIDNNIFVWESDFTYPSYIKHLETQGSHIYILECLYYAISNNYFEDQSIIQGSIVSCIQWSNTIPIKSDATTNTVFEYYNRYCSINNNKIIGYSRGIYYTQNTDQSLTSVIGFSIANNIIAMRNDSDADIGIIAYPGMNIDGNTIYGDNNTSSGIYVRCAYVSVKDLINGPIVTNNKVYGQVTRSIEVGNKTTFQESINRSWNAVVINNVVSKAVYCPNITQNTLEGNVVMPVTENIPLDLARENKNYY